MQTPGVGRADIDPAARTGTPEPAQAQPGAAASDCPFAGQGSITISRVEAQGATQVGPEEIAADTADLLNREADLAVICQIRDRVAALYMRKGRRLTRVELPEQRISDGVLRLRVTEGRIARTSVEGAQAQGPSAALARDYLKKLETGEPADWAKVERAILLVREIPGAEAGVRLRPSTSAPGAVDATAVFAARRRFDFIVGVQHLGSEELGETALYGRADANSFTRFGDRTSLVLFSSTNGAQQVAQLLNEFRIGASGLRAVTDLAYGTTKPEGALEPLDINGDAFVGRVGLSYPLWKTQARRLELAARFEYVDQDNQIGILGGIGGDAATLFEDRLRVFALEADFRWRPPRLPGLSASADVELRKGIEGLGSSSAGDRRLSRLQGQPDFTSVRFQAGARHQFNVESGRGPWIAADVLGQWADGPLLAYEEFQIGNYTVVRGYDPGAASGDQAIAGRIEAGWRFNPAPMGHPSLVDAFVFADAASLKNDDRFGYDSDVWSWGAGVRGQIARRWDFSLVYADPQSEPFPNAPKPDARVLFTLTYAFSFH